jgi:peptidoglycan/LPS O-acetylase OafA/YrhL
MKTLSGVLGFMMLFFVPSEEALAASTLKAVGGWAICLCVATALLAYAGAFKQGRTNSKTSKS